MSNKKSLVITKLTAIILTVLMLFSVVPVSGLIQVEATEPETTVAAESSPDEAPTEPTTEENIVPSSEPVVSTDTDVPEITGFEIIAKTESDSEESKNNTVSVENHGIYSSEAITIKVTAEDKGEVTSDITNVVLYYEGENGKEVVSSDNTAEDGFVFELKTSDKPYKNLSAEVEDASGKKSGKLMVDAPVTLVLDNEEPKKLEFDETNKSDFNIVVSNDPKVIKNYGYNFAGFSNSVEVPEPKKTIYKGDEGTIATTIKDELSGLKSIEVYFGEDSKFGLSDDNTIVVSEETKIESLCENDISKDAKVSTKDIVVETDKAYNGKYQLVIFATNNCNVKQVFEKTVYIDNAAPSDISITFKKAEENKILKFLSFGLYSNESIEATVTVTNANSYESDVNTIQLFTVNNGIDGPKDVQITQNLSNIEKNGNSFSQKFILKQKKTKYDLKISAADAVGNKIEEPISISDPSIKVYSNLKENELKEYPDIKEVVVTKAAPAVYKANDKKEQGFAVSFPADKIDGDNYYAGKGTISCYVEDKLSGLSDINIYFDTANNFAINTNENVTDYTKLNKVVTESNISENKSEKVTGQEVSFTTSGEENGTYYFVVVATNNSGNTTTLRSGELKFDNTKPTVDGFDIAVQGEYTANQKGVYSNNNIIVEVKATDDNSGISNVILYNGTDKVEKDTTQPDKNAFVLKVNEEPYKYILSAVVIDNLGNVSEQIDLVKSKVTLTETKDGTTTVSNLTEFDEDFAIFVNNDPNNIKIETLKYNGFDKADATNSLYKGKGSITTTVTDDLSGIKDVTVNISTDSVKFDPMPDGSYEVEDNGKVTIDFSKYLNDENQTSLPTGTYTVQVVATNNCTVKKTVESTFFIDNTAPEIVNDISVEKGPEASLLSFLTFGIYSNDKITVTITVKDAAVSSGISDFYLSNNKTYKDGNKVTERIDGIDETNSGSKTEGYTIEKSFTLEADEVSDVFDIAIVVKDNVDLDRKYYIGVDENENILLHEDESQGSVEIVTTKDAPAILKSNETQGIDIAFDNVSDDPLPNAEGDGTPEVYSGNGTFSATVKDDKSGIKDIYAYFGKADEITVSEDGTVTTTDDNLVKDLSKTDISKTENKKVTARPIEYKTDSIKSGIYTFAIVTINNSGNSTTEFVTIAIDNTDPVVEGFEFKTAEKAKTHYAENTFYTNKNVDVIAKASDASPSAGFTSIEIFDGEVAIGTSPEYLTLDAEYRMELSKTNEDYVLKATATDQFSHTNTLSLENTASIVVDGDVVENVDKVQIDTEAPKITGFKFAEVVDDTIESHSESEYERDYGYFFENNVTITVTATDKSGSGVQGIYFVTTDVNGNGSSSYAQTKTDPIATFTIPANFKGHIYAYAVDNLYQEGEQFCPNDLVVEDKFMHDNTSSIVFSRAATGYKDVNGLDLYDGDVPVTITVEDTFSGLAKVEYTVEAPYDTENNVGVSLDVSLGADKKGTNLAENGWTILGQDKNLVTKMTKTIMVSNNSNNIVVKAKITDNAGFEREETITPFSIDKTNPVVEVTYDNHDFKEYQGQKYYKADRTATITVTERNFNAAGFKEIIDQPYEMGSWSSSVDTSNPDNSKHTVQIKFSSDDDYTVDMTFKDLVDRPSNAVAQEKFTIDKTNPTVNVSFDNNSSLNNNYFKAQRTATITINEHNFAADAEHLAINITALGEDNASAATPPSVSGWSTSGDVHTATITFANDGKYAFTVDYKDLAYNNAEQSKVDEFYVDKTEPDIKFANVENNAAYSGEIAPKVILTDNNYNGYTTFTLQRIDMKAKAQVVDFDKSSYMTGSSGEVITFDNFSAIEDNDGIYKLTVKMMDKAGNEKSAEIVFSVNRFGSTFLAGNEQTQQLVATGYTNAESDIVIKEINVNKVSAQTISLALNNSDIRELKLNQDFTVANSGGSDSWHEYSYSINKDNFVEEGYYTLTLSTTDSVEHTLSNRTALTESRKYPVSFTVDKTDPSVRITGVEANVPYEEASKTVRVICEDANINPETIVIKLNGEVLEAGTDFELTNENAGEVIAIFDVEAIGNDFKQSIEATVVDFAGNDNANDVSNFILSASLITRFFANTPLVIITFSCLGLAIATVVIIIVKKRKKDEQN